MKTTSCLALFLAGAVLATAASCRAPAKGGARAAAADSGAAAEEAKSDLDRPVGELFAETCEHRMKMFECDECRYEVGVARAPADLFAGGLLRTETAARQRIAFPLRLTGEVQFDAGRVAHLGAQAEGIIRETRVALGQRVTRGQPLVEVECAAVGEAEAAWLEAQAALQLARRNHDRVAELRAEGIAAEKELLEARQGLEAAEIRVAAARGALARLGMSENDVRGLTHATVRGRLTLRAPVDGTVLMLHAVPGEVAAPGEVLATIGDTSTLWVWCDVYERDLARVAAAPLARGLPATVTVRAYPDERFSGRVDLVGPAMEEASRTVRLRVRVDNPGGRLLAGMFADVEVLLPGTAQGLALPQAAVLEDEGRSFVFVRHHADYYVRRPVTTGRAWGDRVEISGGLRGGETVVAEGAFLLKSDVLRSKMGAGCAD